MRLDKLKKNIGWRMQIAPPACHLDAQGCALPDQNEDWIIQSVTDDVLTMDSALGFQLLLGTDHIYSFYTNPQRSMGGLNHGILSLHVQVFIQGPKLFIRPNARPGERVPPEPVAVTEKLVSLNYPTESGIQQRLERQGYTLTWSRESRLQDRIDLSGHEIVIEADKDGRLFRFRCRNPGDDMILVKKRAQ